MQDFFPVTIICRQWPLLTMNTDFPNLTIILKLNNPRSAITTILPPTSTPQNSLKVYLFKNKTKLTLLPGFGIFFFQIFQ